MKRYLYLHVLFIMIIQPFIVKAQVFDYPLSVDVNIMPPYPVRLSDFTDFDSQVLINVENNSPTESYEINFIGSLTSDNGVNITTRINNLPPCLNQTIMPGMSNSFTGNDLREMFTASYLTIDPATQQYINQNAALPQGSYTFCIRAFACGDPRRALSPPTGMMEGCVTFPIDYVQPPILRYPECDNVVPLTNVTEFRWDPVFSIQPGPILYKLQIVEVLPAGSDPTQAFLNATEPYLVDIDNISPTNYNFDPAMYGVLEEGTQYAYRIVAYQDEAMGSTVVFENGGASVPCKITFGNAVAGFAFEATFPQNGDFIPYDFFPFITRFSPYNDRFIRFEGDFILLEKQGGSYNQIASRTSNNAWGNGPRRSQSSGGFTVTEEQAQFLPVYLNLTESPMPATFERGKQYAWRFTGNMEVRGGSPVSDDITQVEFTVGMSPPGQISPANGSTQEAGNINLQWKSADQPSSVVPFNVSQWGRNSDGVGLYNNSIDEHWVLEVSKSADFDTIFFTDHNRLTYTSVGSDDESAITTALYGNLERTHAFADEGTYYWRIKWLTNPADTASEAYSISPVWNFNVGSPSPTTPVPEETPAECVSECLMAEITDETAVAIEVDATVKMGKFNMKVTRISSSNNNQYSGEGEIAISFLNNVKVKVEFANIKANAAGQIFTGKAKAMDDLPHISADSVSTFVNGLPVSIPDFNEAQSDAIEEVFETGERLVSVIGGSRAMGMPLGFDKEIDDYRFVIGITEMHFLPRKADITAVARIDIPALGEKLPAFGARGVCITPGGLGDEYALYLARDHEIVTAGDFSFVFNGNMAGDTTKASYIEFDCTGFKCVRLAGTVTIPGDKLVAVKDDRTIDEEGHVEGEFAFKGCRGKNFIGSIGISAFQIKGMKGWSFKPMTAYLDWSDHENPPGFEFPEGYETGLPADELARLSTTWKGFYLKELSLQAPPEFDKNIAGDVLVNVQNVIIDQTGFTGTVNVRNLIDYDDGEVEGWAFSLDSIGFGVIQNTNISGGFKGKLGTPIFDDEDYLNYNAALTFVRDTLNYNFRVYAKDTLAMDIWKAKVTLNPDSQILFKGGTTVETELSMDLNGTVSIEGDLGLPQLSLPGIKFQDLHLSTKDQFRIGHFGFTSPQKSAAGFPLNAEIGFTGGFTNPGLDLDLGLTLSNAGFHAEVGLLIMGKVETDENGRIKLKYDSERTRLDAITINQTMDGGINIDGSLQFYREDIVYGNGMEGDVKVTLPMDMAVAVKVQFGTKRTDLTADFNEPGYFSYWYVDGSLRIPQGTVPLFPGFELRGFGGGAYHHMRLTTEPRNVVGGEEGEPSRRSGAVYEPHFPTTLGLKASIVMAMTEPKTFNMDVGVQARFVDYGLASLVVSGDGYIMAGFDERPDAKVTANIEIGYHNDGEGGKRVEGDFDVFVNVDPILKGSGPDNQFVDAGFFADGRTWRFYMGKQPLHERGGLTLNVYNILQAHVDSYLMVGYGIPAELPPLPREVAEMLYGPQQGRISGALDGGAASRQMIPGQSDNLDKGKGFAMGAHLDFRADMDFAIFYAILELWAGFDINISQNANRVCFETGLRPGINDWYATGQMYVALRGELGVQVNLWFIRGRFPIIELGAAVSLTGGVPKPVWMEGRAGLTYAILGGRIKGHCNFAIEAGQKCSYADPNPFSDIEFISGFSPDEGDDDISVFTAPQVSFSLPVNEFLELPAGLEDQPEVVRVFYPFVERSETTLQDLKNNINVVGSYKMGVENVIGVFQPNSALEAQAEHRFEVTVRSNEHFPDRSVRPVIVNDTVWEERKSVTFTSGDRPDVIEEAQVAYTYPINRQAYFMKNETNNGKGLLQYVSSGQDYLFNNETGEDGQRYTFSARYIKLDDNSELEGDIRLGTRKLFFEVPSGLQNSAIYGVQIVRKKYQRPPTEEERRAAMLREADVRPGASVELLAPTILKEFDLRDKRGGLAGTADLELKEAQLLPAEIARPSEKVLYSFYFRTSKFNSLQEKLGTVNLNQQYFYGNGSLFEHVKLIGRIEELFDDFEVNGFFKNGTKVLEPIIKIYDRHTVSSFNAAANQIYTLYNDLKMLDGSTSNANLTIDGRSVNFGTTFNMSFGDLNSTRRGKAFMNRIPHNTVSISSKTKIGEPLADWELDKAAGINEYAPVEPTTNNSSTSTSGSRRNNSSVDGFNVGPETSVSNSIISTNSNFVGISGGTGYSMAGLTAGINLGEANVINSSNQLNLGATGGTATSAFELICATSMYVKLDALNFQSQLTRWMSESTVATERTPRRLPIRMPLTNSVFVAANPTLSRKINQFFLYPTSYYSFRNGRYRIRINYDYPGIGGTQGIDKYFTITEHDEILR